jgi:hypothetical protein
VVVTVGVLVVGRVPVVTVRGLVGLVVTVRVPVAGLVGLAPSQNHRQ